MVLQYIVPGLWCIILFNFIMSKKSNEKATVMLSCVISYVLLTIVTLLRTRYFKTLPDTPLLNSGIGLIIGTISIIIIIILSQRKWFKKILVTLFHKTLNNDIWRDVLDFENGSNLKVYIKDKDYYIIGHYKNHEEKGDDSWLALNAFAKFEKETNKNYKKEPSYLDNEAIIVTIRFRDIEHIEIF